MYKVKVRDWDRDWKTERYRGRGREKENIATLKNRLLTIFHRIYHGCRLCRWSRTSRKYT